ncbi:MAG: hypothetical protein K6D03_03300 [Solobacterium sp.]|nr:hypothetical protein [Solobacterium sp.]
MKLSKHIAGPLLTASLISSLLFTAVQTVSAETNNAEYAVSAPYTAERYEIRGNSTVSFAEEVPAETETKDENVFMNFVLPLIVMFAISGLGAWKLSRK